MRRHLSAVGSATSESHGRSRGSGFGIGIGTGTGTSEHILEDNFVATDLFKLFLPRERVLPV